MSEGKLGKLEAAQAPRRERLGPGASAAPAGARRGGVDVEGRQSGSSCSFPSSDLLLLLRPFPAPWRRGRWALGSWPEAVASCTRDEGRRWRLGAASAAVPSPPPGAATPPPLPAATWGVRLSEDGSASGRGLLQRPSTPPALQCRGQHGRISWRASATSVQQDANRIKHLQAAAHAHASRTELGADSLQKTASKKCRQKKEAGAASSPEAWLAAAAGPCSAAGQGCWSRCGPCRRRRWAGGRLCASGRGHMRLAMRAWPAAALLPAAAEGGSPKGLCQPVRGGPRRRCRSRPAAPPLLPLLLLLLAPRCSGGAAPGCASKGRWRGRREGVGV